MAYLSVEVNKSKNSSYYSNLLAYRHFILIFMILLLGLITWWCPSAAADQTLTPGNNSAVDLLIENNQPVHLQIDTSALGGLIHGKIPITFYSADDSVQFSANEQLSRDLHWHNKPVPVATDTGVVEANSDRLINLQLNITDDMVGKRVRVQLEKEENLSKVAAASAFVPQILPILAMNDVTWQPNNFWPTLLRWNYLLLEIDLLQVIDKFLHNRVFDQSQSLFAQCSRDFVAGFATYAMLANYGEEIAGDPGRPTADGASSGLVAKNEVLRSKSETFRLFLRATPPNALLNCLSKVVGDSLKTLHSEGQLPKLVGQWPLLGSLNDETLEGIAILMVGYGFNLFGNVPGMTLAQLREDVGLEVNDNIAGDFNDALKISIQYSLHKGYMKFFTGRGWGSSAAYALSAGAGLLEIAYRFHQVTNAIPAGQDERFDSLNKDLQHHIISIGERAEAIVSSGYQLIPTPKKLHEYALPIAVTTGLPLVAYYVLYGVINYYTTGGTNVAMQKALTSATNGLVLGALYYIILPKAQAYSSQLTQMAADKVVSWTQAQNDSWIGYFAARDTQYQIRVSILD